MLLPPASPADIVRANTKDEEYISTVESYLHDLLQTTLPNRTSSAMIQTASATVARLFYYLFTPRGQLALTPGEEYAGILGAHLTRRIQLPSISTRVLLGFLRALTSDHALWIARRVWQRMCSVAWPAGLAAAIVEVLQRAHLALFYWRGWHYGIAERLMRVKYVATTAWGSATRLRILAWVVGLQLVADVVRATTHTVRRALRERACGSFWETAINVLRVAAFPAESAPSDEGVGRCMMCLGGLRTPTLTSCGHVFCWECICGWCATNEDCPLCRQPVLTRKLVCLNNY